MSNRGERRERAEARAERARERAEVAETEYARDPAHNIPVGQPILVGHHSQRRLERDLERMRAKLGRAVEAREDAAAAEERARNAGYSIQVGDTDAVAALKGRIERLVAAHESVLAHNRSGGLCAGECRMCERGARGRPVPSFTLAKSRARIRHARNQLAKAEAQTEAAVVGDRVLATGDGWRLVRDPGAARVRFVFDDKPDDRVRDLLKSGGFRWAPGVGAWQRQDTANGLDAATRVAVLLRAR